MPHRWRGWLAALIVVIPVAASGQRTPDRDAVFRLRDSLVHSTDTAMLLALETRSIDSARHHRDDALLHLRLGYVGLRIGELTGAAAHYRDAEGEFEWATQLQPKWPLGWYALGTAEIEEADAYPAALRALFRALGRDLFGPAAHDIARSAQVDSTFVTGVVELGDDALRRGMESHLAAALTAFREVGAAPASHNRVGDAGPRPRRTRGRRCRFRDRAVPVARRPQSLRRDCAARTGAHVAGGRADQRRGPVVSRAWRGRQRRRLRCTGSTCRW